jgi:hypothetical protein
MTKRKFYQTVFEVEVLHEEPIPSHLTLPEVLAECEEGAWSGGIKGIDEVEHLCVRKKHDRCWQTCHAPSTGFASVANRGGRAPESQDFGGILHDVRRNGLFEAVNALSVLAQQFDSIADYRWQQDIGEKELKAEKNALKEAERVLASHGLKPGDKLRT